MHIFPRPDEPPGSNTPGRLPVTQGRLLDFVEDPMACMLALRAEHGNLAVLEEDSQRIVFVFGPDWNQRVLSDCDTFHSRFFAIRGPRNSAQRRLTSGIMSMNGEAHKEHRRIVKGPFEKKSIPFHHDPICSITQGLLESWKPGEVRDLHVDMTRFMLHVTSAILFGVDQPVFAWRVGEMIDRWVAMNHETGMGAFVSNPELNDRYDRLLSFADKLEADIREMVRLRRENPKPADDVLSLLIRANELENTVSDEELIGHVALLYGAAHLTTAHTLTWTLFLLAEHPAIMRQLHQEIVATMRGDCPTLDELNRMPFTERVLKEAMRILPASSYSQRICAEPTMLADVPLNRGTPIVFSQYVTHHMPELYPEPESFRPERWTGGFVSPYAYLPFGAGAKMCIGAPLAMMTLRTVLPAILKKFRLSIVAGCEINGKIVSTMLGPTTPVPVLVARQDGQFHASPVTGNIHSMVRLPDAAETRLRRAA
jgi:cytochrome P450